MERGAVELGNLEVFQGIQRAKHNLAGHVHRTNLVQSRTFSRMCQNQVYLKLENLQKTGAFKVRGALNKVFHLRDTCTAGHLVTASAGNHAQGVALAGKMWGLPVTVVMSEKAPEAKIKATEGYGAQVVLAGSSYNEAYERALAIQRDTGAVFVHAFDDREVIAGQGTIGLELLEDLPDMDCVVVPIGGGGLISGIAVAVKNISPRVRVIGVQAERAPSAYYSRRLGSSTEYPAGQTVADGIAVNRPGQLPFQLMQQYVDDIVTVTEGEICQAMVLLAERSKMIVEGAGAAALAAVLNDKLKSRGTKVAIIVSGGNMDISQLSVYQKGSSVAV